MPHILLIENNKKDLIIIDNLLRTAGYEVTSTEYEKEGIKICRSVLPDLVICANNPPNIKGYPVLLNIRNNPYTASIPVILFGNDQTSGAFRYALNHGAENYLFKPVKSLHLFQAVELILKRVPYQPVIRKEVSVIKPKEAFENLKCLAKKSTYQVLQKGDLVYQPGSKPHFLYFINEGSIKIMGYGCYDKEVIIHLLGSGDFFGYTSIILNETYNEKAVALEKTKLSLIEAEGFLESMAGNKSLMLDVVKMLAEESTDFKNIFERRAYYSIRQRIILELLAMSRKQSRGINTEVPVKVTRSTLAKILGTSTESVIRVISDLKSSDHISEVNGTLILKDPKKLQKLPA